MRLKIEGVPAGQYTGEFSGIDATESPEYGPGLIWRWTIRGGQHDGQSVTRVTGATPTAKNAAGKMLRAISGRQLAPGVTIEADDYIGRQYHLIVADAPSGNGTRVESCVASANDDGNTDKPPF